MKLTVLACAALLGLTACGGSSGSGGLNYNGGSNNNSIAPVPAPAPSPSQSYDGVVIPGEIDNGGKTPTQTISSNNFDKITVNGIDITLKREGISAGTFTRIT